jgi:L-histidine N-alpha-methyltransferase
LTTLASERDLELLPAVIAGLSGTPKSLPCRLFYDHEGSLLFEQICDLPEYYLTRTEAAILQEHAARMVAELPPGVELVELGSGSSRKTRIVLEALLRRQASVRYVPVDISAEMLRRTARDLSAAYPRLTVEPLAAEYREALRRLRSDRSRPKLVLFLGSNLGNFTPDEAVDFLRQIRAILGPADRALIGLDLQKDAAVIEAAYDDAAGVTAAFNRNLLRRLNRELGADFEPERFRHRAVYNASEGRIEMYLVSEAAQTVCVAGRPFHFAPGEAIHTENSHKYTRPGIRALAAAAGFEVAQAWTDAREWFSVNLLAPVEP